MDLLRALPYDGFRYVESKLKGEPRVTLEAFTEVLTDACKQFGVDSSSITRRALQTLFHQVDFHDQRRITWEQLTMHMIEDAQRMMASEGVTGGESVGRGDSAPARSDFTSLDHSGALRQIPNAKVRMVKYVEPWDRMVRVIHMNNGQESALELTSIGSLDHISKFSGRLNSAVAVVEAVPEHNLIAAAHQDMTYTFHGAQVLREGPHATAMPLHRHVPLKETEESTTSMIWHPLNNALYSGFRSGTIAAWNLRLDKALLTERYQLLPRVSVFEHPISCLIPFEEKIVVSSIDSYNNIALYDVERSVMLERLRGHSLGVTSVARIDSSDLIVSAGFERTPFIWMLKIRDFPPWKLIDKQEPHKGNITQVHCPPLSNKVFTSDDRGMIKLWDIRTMRCIQSMYGDQPPPPKLHSNTAAINNHFHAVTFQTAQQTLVSCGPQGIHYFRGNVPQNMDCTDDLTLSALLYHTTQEAIYTAHQCSVKVWNCETGAVMSHYCNLTLAPITAMCFDNRGRKFFVGTSQGHVVGFNVTTGSQYRTFRPMQGEIVSLVYGMLKNGARCLLALTPQEIMYYDDTDMDGRQQLLSHPMQHIRMLLSRNIDDPAEADRKSAVAQFRGLRCQPKLSLAYVWARWYLIALDLYTLSVTHHFDLDGNEVVAACPLGDLPAVAALDHNNVLYVYAVRPSTAAGNVLLRFDLSQAAQGSESSCDRRTRQSLVKFRRLSMRRKSEESFIKSVVSEFVPQDDTAPNGQYGCILSYHQGKRTLYVSDAGGMLWEWSLDEFIKRSQLQSAHYPMQSITDHLLRKPVLPLSEAEAIGSVTLTKAFVAHMDEIRFLEVVFHNSSTVVFTGGSDNRVAAWGSNGCPLGELSQGRFLRPDLITDKAAMQTIYDRYRIKPWLFSHAPKDTDLSFIDDLPSSVLRLLRRAATRYKGRIRTFRRKHDSLPSSPMDVLNHASGSGGHHSAFPSSVDNVEVIADADVASSDTLLLPREKREISVMYTLGDGAMLMTPASRESGGGPSWLPQSTEGEEGHHHDERVSPEHVIATVHKIEMVPKAKFRVRGAMVMSHPTCPPPAGGGRSPRVSAPRQVISQRKDMPLSRTGVEAQLSARDEARERTVANALHMNWDVYQRTSGVLESAAAPIDFSRSSEAIHMRRVFVPQIPSLKPPSREATNGRIPLTARDQERFAVARLLGEDVSSSAPKAMDDFHLLDSGGYRLR